MASKRRNMFQKNKTQETTENGAVDMCSVNDEVNRENQALICNSIPSTRFLRWQSNGGVLRYELMTLYNSLRYSTVDEYLLPRGDQDDAKGDEDGARPSQESGAEEDIEAAADEHGANGRSGCWSALLHCEGQTEWWMGQIGLAFEVLITPGAIDNSRVDRLGP
ncbi:hypothetical protein AAG570_006761 [Ranatra chinensis]|uniref:Uncharacterized protein n=1 Tax=Ranatra chinensis TaxID=642074 RepID=A0ABD0ZI99_9HEMI